MHTIGYSQLLSFQISVSLLKDNPTNQNKHNQRMHLLSISVQDTS